MRNTPLQTPLYKIEKLEVQAMNTISAVAKRFAPTLMISLSKTITQRQAYRLGDWLASVVVRHVPLLPIDVMRTNLSVILGVPECDPRIDEALLGFVKNIFWSYVDFFMALRGGRDKVVASIDFHPEQRKKINNYLASGQSVVLAGAHNCGFDFGIIALTGWLPDAQLLSKPKPKGEFKFMHKLRLRFGLNMTPISAGALRQAVHRLKDGGVVVIANDLPIKSGCKFKLFGKDVKFTTGHARLAMKSNAVMMMALTHRVAPEQYQVILEEIPQPKPTGDRHTDTIRWAGKSYACLEKYIRRWPEEWYGLMMKMFEG
jgi:lauroyl/myristoyl acyltransferase